MLFKPTIVASLSGSLGGITASHNRFGAYLRERVIPVNPGTQPQVIVRNAFHVEKLQPRRGTVGKRNSRYRRWRPHSEQRKFIFLRMVETDRHVVHWPLTRQKQPQQLRQELTG